jgi:hypothetical protein
MKQSSSDTSYTMGELQIQIRHLHACMMMIQKRKMISIVKHVLFIW